MVRLLHRQERLECQQAGQLVQWSKMRKFYMKPLRQIGGIADCWRGGGLSQEAERLCMKSHVSFHALNHFRCHGTTGVGYLL